MANFIYKKIQSLQHPLIKYAAHLNRDKQLRYSEKKVLVSGIKMVKELALLSSLEMLFIDEERFEGFHPEAQHIYLVPLPLLKKMTGLPSPESMAAIMPLPSFSSLNNKQLVIGLDGVADPGNVGALLRSALALGWEGALFTEETADPFHEKALRASKGASLRFPLNKIALSDLPQWIETHGFHPFIADTRGTPCTEVCPKKPLLLFFGNESHGISPSLKNYPSLSIPMRGDMESLNVAAAGAILIYLLSTTKG
jgi:RNA methyltransferase, TrmH family